MQSATPSSTESTAATPSPAAPHGEDGPLVRIKKSELEQELTEAIDGNAAIGWLREHPWAYYGVAMGATLAAAIVMYVAIRVLAGLVVRLRHLQLHRTAARSGVPASAGDQLALKAFQESRAIGPLAWILPFVVAWRGISLWPGLPSPLVETFGRTMLGIAIAVGLLAVARLLRGIDLVVSARMGRPDVLRGYVQAVSAVVGIVGVITIVAILVGKSPVFFLTGVGAFAAILAVVLKDPLLSMVANIQMTMGDTLRVGDWIELRQHGIDGRVEEIRLTSTRVRNWDDTTLQVPNHRFVTEIFVNYRTTDASGGRRMRRTVGIDPRSVRALSSAEIAAALSEPALRGAAEAARSAAATVAARGEPVLTNLALYRAYLERFLADHPAIDPTRPIVVRQSEPGSNGIPIEVLAFLPDSDLREFDALQASVLDHLFGVTGCFGLRPFTAGAEPLREPLPFLPVAERFRLRGSSQDA
jgi:miniconductance mechanosensitive channel